jgi:hypothetical protein
LLVNGLGLAEIALARVCNVQVNDLLQLYLVVVPGEMLMHVVALFIQEEQL